MARAADATVRVRGLSSASVTEYELATFQEKYETDPAFRAEMDDAASVIDAVEVAARYGFTLTDEHFGVDRQLGDRDLENVTGGYLQFTYHPPLCETAW